MKYIKYLFIILVLCGIGAGWFYFKNYYHLEKKSASTIIASLQETKEINRFYTGVYYIPVVDFQRGYLKRDIIKEGVKSYFNPLTLIEKGRRYFNDEPLIQGDEGRNVIKGCCFKKYEVAVGYDKLMDILGNEQLIVSVCTGHKSTLPEPEILAINCKSASAYGKYDSSGACYGWDSNETERKNLIKKVMAEDGILPKVNERGREALKNLLTAFCQ